MLLPLIILLANEGGTSDSEISHLRKEGQNIANRFVVLLVMNETKKANEVHWGSYNEDLKRATSN